MEKDSSPITIYQSRAIKVFNALIACLEDIKDNNFSTDFPKKAIEQIITLCKFIKKNQLKNVPENKDDLENRFVFLKSSIGELIKSIGYFDNADSGKTPFALSYMVKELSQNTPFDLNYFAFPINSINYLNIPLDIWFNKILMGTFQSEKIKNLIKNANIRLIGFPRILSKDILSSVMVGHELGHEFAFKILEIDRNGMYEPNTKIKEACAAITKEELKKISENSKLSPGESITLPLCCWIRVVSTSR